MKVDPVYITSTVGFMAYAQLSAPAVSMPIAEAVFFNEASDELYDLLPDMSLADIHRIISGLGGDQLAVLGPEMVERVIRSIVRNMSKAYSFCFVGAAIMILISVYFAIVELGKRRKAKTGLEHNAR